MATMVDDIPPEERTCTHSQSVGLEAVLTDIKGSVGQAAPGYRSGPGSRRKDQMHRQGQRIKDTGRPGGGEKVFSRRRLGCKGLTCKQQCNDASVHKHSGETFAAGAPPQEDVELNQDKKGVL